MIYTVTCNPSLDYVVAVEDFTVGSVNRSKGEEIFPGGKGINVSIVLQRLGLETTILGFKAGFTGDEIERLLALEHCHTKLLPLKSGFSRINVKVRGAVETAVNGAGPNVEVDDLAALVAILDKLGPDDWLVLSGSRPASATDHLYGDIASLMKQRGVRCIVDATGELLRLALPYEPFLVKPNREELEELLQESLPKREDVADGARQLRRMGAKNVLVSLGAEGALLVDEKDIVHYHRAPKGKPVNTVGAGDSMVAGFLKGYLTEQDYDRALWWGLCAGSATAFTMHLADRKAIETFVARGE
jgi:1-phosphofructokinase